MSKRDQKSKDRLIAWLFAGGEKPEPDRLPVWEERPSQGESQQATPQKGTIH